ncbi:MAG: NCS2 family permease [Planctomycetes bacterium]|nr:NCS2 family permease [Planctomycetota bacterium]
MLERFFKFREHGTKLSTEVMAGLATFLTAVYILVVNPSILANTGMPQGAQFTATCIAIIVGTLLMAIFANMPFILAPGMGINVYFTYSIVLGKGYSWQEGLTAVLIAGILFVVAGAIGLRKALLQGFPEPLKNAITVSLGLMIAVIGMKNAGMIVIHEEFISMGDITSGSAMLAMIGVLITGILIAAKAPAPVLLGIIITTVLGIFNGVTNYQPMLETGAVSMPPSISPIAMAFTFDATRILTFDFIIIILTLLVIDIFDSLGTFVGVFNHFDASERAKYEARIPAALMADAVATVVGAGVGTSTVTTYVESSTGIAAGGRTGLTAVVIAILVFIALFASPLFLMVPAAATAPALIVVGMYMMNQSGKIKFLDVTEGLPAIIAILVTALTWSISDGIMYGWIGYLVFKLCSGKTRELNPTVVIVGIFFIIRMILL